MIKDGSIDYMTPQIYWSRQLDVANYSVLLDWWSREVTTYNDAHPVNLYIGLADSQTIRSVTIPIQPGTIHTSYPGNLDNRSNGIAKGQMHFSLRQIENNALGTRLVSMPSPNFPASPFEAVKVSMFISATIIRLLV
ncbi:hypothetical protein ACFO4N_11965 [Camelliibacillus cellulosilyticus]|uniref:Uncharacterized protein n=1 Tax=Camelliibacillus cellulosilyticus TaxID=2174486 RepID=A0ABV9GRY9_9BACL